MTKKKFYLTFFFFALFLNGFGQFTPGNIVVSRIGDGISNLTTSPSLAMPVYIDEYTQTGVLVQSIALPTTANGSNNALTLPASPGDLGLVSISADGQYLVLGGFNAAIGTIDVAFQQATDIPRVIGLIDFNGGINTTTALTDWVSGSNVMSAASTDGINLWGAGSLDNNGTGGVRYTTLGSSTSVRLNSTGLTTLRVLKISGGQLYVSIGRNIFKVGNGVPTTPDQLLTDIGLTPSEIGLNNQYYFADLNSNIPNDDVLYVANERQGIRKYSLVGGIWTLNGTIGTDGDDYRGLTAITSGTTVTLFATRIGSNDVSIGGGQLIKLIDASGYNNPISGTATVIANVPTDKASFRGIALAPQKLPFCQTPANIISYNITPNNASISWNTVSNAVGYQYALTNNVTPPSSGTSIASTDYNATGLTQGQTYFFHVRTDCGNFNSSTWSTVSFVPSCVAPPLLTVNNVGYIADVKWNTVLGASGYEYAVTTNVTPPSSGVATTDTSYVANNLSSATQYYVHVRSDCEAGGYSIWSTKGFKTSCLNPLVTISNTGDAKQFNWNKVNGAVNYEYALTTYRTPPLGGTIIQDTAIQFSKLNTGTGYYFHARTQCAKNGGESVWTTVPFQTTGLDAYPNPVSNTLSIKLYGTSTSGGIVLISDVMGRVVKTISMITNSIDVNVEDLAAGVYIVRYSDGTNKYQVKVLKK